MSGPDIAKIAAGLTKAQRETVMGRQRSRRRPTELEIARRGTASALRRLGVLDGGLRLTPLGLAVRAHLLPASPLRGEG
jgi:hypothetical protein